MINYFNHKLSLVNTFLSKNEFYFYFQFAHKMGTVVFNSDGPGIFKEIAMHVMKTSRPLYNRLTVFVIGHMILSYTITHYQMKNLEFLKNKMFEEEQEEIRRLRETKKL